MSHRILITGSSGLVGSALWLALQTRGIEVRGLDLRGRGVDAGDVRDVEHVHAAVQDCDGVIQLAAVSRVIWAERDPALCRETNVDGLRNVLEAALQSRRRPWLLFASSREVYGQPTRLPATEDAPLRPVNTYGRSKVEGERMVEAAKTEGLRAAIIRLSNVFGSTTDHADRVVPAFARAAARGLPLRVEGAEHTFDFTHMDDVTRGILALVELLLEGREAPPPIQFVSGTPTTLEELAALAMQIAGGTSTLTYAPPRDFDVARFYGNRDRARRLLDWSPRVSLRQGLTRLIDDFGVACAQPQQLEAQ